MNNRDRLLARDDATVLSLRLFELLPEHPIVFEDYLAHLRQGTELGA